MRCDTFTRSSRTRGTLLAELRCLHETRVAPEEIDHLGHMNVGFYFEKALRATRALASAHGLTEEKCGSLGSVLEVRDAFTRHYREQLVDAPLAVFGGVLVVRPGGLRIYHELRNTERDELAATFMHEAVLRDRKMRDVVPLPEMCAKSAGDELVSWPEHGRPRTIDLEHDPGTLTLETARARGLAMREVRVIQAEECDADGVFKASRYQDLVWGGEPLKQRSAMLPLHALPGGGKMGWATMENRGILTALPRAGARVQSFGAEVELGRKTSYRHNWVFDVDSGALACTSSIVNLAFDLQKRRSMEPPAAVRQALEEQLHPDLR